ncbi:MAG: insulinase family protein [Opitutaceae bacterium]
MRSFSRRQVLAVVLAVFWPVLLMADPRTGTWAHESSSLKPDPDVVWGSLENGLRYAILPHGGLPGRVSIQLLVLAGSLDEKENERGLAHFTEHMAFNGTRNFQSSEMISFFQHLGMEFGSDVNAVTTHDHTVYILDFQDNSDALLRRGLVLLRDFADGIEFSQAEIDKERGVILSELRIHDGFEFRSQNASTSFFFSGLTLPDRNPIGLTKVIETASRSDFMGYYTRNYRPDLMILVVAGDIQVDGMIGLTREFFGSMAKPTTRVPDRDLGKLNTGRGIRADIFEVSHVGSASIQVASVEPDRDRTDSLAARKRWNDSQLAAQLLTNRLQRMIQQAGGAGASVERSVGITASMAGLYTAGGEGWRNGLLSLDQVIRLTYEDGFQAKEADWLKKRGLLDLGKARAQYAKLDPNSIASALVESIVSDQVFIGIEADLAMREQFLRELNIADVNKAFRDSWNMENMAYHISGEVVVKGGPTEIVDDIRRHRKGGISYVSMQADLTKEFELQDWGPPGEVVERREVPELNAGLMKFSNGVRFNFVESRQEPSIVRAVVRVGGGMFDLKGNRKAIRDFALATVLLSGTSHYMADDIGSFLSASMLDFSFDLDDHDAFTFRGAFGSEDLDTFLGIVTEFLYQPKFSRGAFNSELVGAMQARQGSSLGLQDGFRKLDNHLYRTDARFVWGDPMDYATLGVSDVRNWVEKPLTEGYVEVTLVGDIPEEMAVASMARTLGELPKRAAKKKTGFVRPVKMAAGPGFQRVEFVGEDHQAVAVGIWPIEGKITLQDRANLNVLSRILQVRISREVREDLGLAYSPSSELIAYPEYESFALIQATVDCSPADAEAIARKVERIADEISTEGVTREEFDGAIEPFIGHMRQAFSNNGFLIEQVLMRAQEDPQTLDEAIQLKKELPELLSLEEVNRFAAKVMGRENTRTVAIVPKPFVGVFQIDSGGSAGADVIGRPGS